ncbi:radical SAM protein [Alloacidobacterium dinghuense]|uniref:Radical SAM protein n=1 Tax=Alloacidobacterium dinghuense TaxID=2763107 RepID=A0A7G8BCF3_9BACT|nr:radical SAM protein [Alloacidobacterium dinghuense]QNI30223.1 radical SAM protein [Alloacidobacterium dinghuense]
MGEEKANLSLGESLFIEDDPPVKLVGIARLANQAELADTSHLTEYRAIHVRSILNKSVSKRGLPFGKTINPYRGCEFGCRYCFARYTHEFMELRDPTLFERLIFVKQNAAWLLRQELRKLRPGEEIAMGTATDPYQPIERRMRVTRSLLEVMADCRGLNLGIVTKSTLILRDIDLLQEFALRNRLSIHLSITTPDAKLARILEPRAPRPDLRFKAVAALRSAGLRAGILCCPIMPGINDTPAAFDAMARRAKAVQASFLAANPLFLKPCSKATFMDFVQQNFPTLAPSYEKRYEDNAFVSKAYQKRIADLLALVNDKYGLGKRRGEFQPAQTPPVDPGPLQQSLWPEQAKLPQQAQTDRVKQRFSA